MGPTDIILPLVAALWALGSLIHNVVQELNEKRDRILTGRHGDIRLSDEHRRLYLENDWIPLNFLVILASFGFGSIALLLPLLLTEEDRSSTAWCVCSVVALFSIICGSTMLACMLTERRFILGYLSNKACSDLEHNHGKTTTRRGGGVKRTWLSSRPHAIGPRPARLSGARSTELTTECVRMSGRLAKRGRKRKSVSSPSPQGPRHTL